MKDGFTTEKSPQPITNCRRCILLPKDLCSSLIKLVAVAANLPHELAGLLGGDVMLAGKVVDAIGASDSRRRMSFFRFFRFAMPTAFSIIGSSELSIAEIAISSGFADQSHFTRVYAQMTGTSPGAWRRMRTPRLASALRGTSAFSGKSGHSNSRHTGGRPTWRRSGDSWQRPV